MSLQTRVFVLVLVTNVLLFGAGSAFFLQTRVDVAATRARERVEDLLFARLPQGDDGARLGVLLRWPYWGLLDDAILMDRNFSVDDVTGTVSPSMFTCNPLGRERRAADFDEQGALRAIARAVGENQRVRAADGGFAFPLQGQGGVWGGLWYRPRADTSKGALVARILPWFLASTLLLTAGTFWALRRLVLDPVDRLAGHVHDVGSGAFHLRLADGVGGAPELEALVRSFNEMTGRVESFDATLREEVRVASEKARQAEAALMTQRRLAAMGELAAGIAHEINNPLGGLSNAVEQLAKDDLPADRRRTYLDLLRRGLVRIGETVHRLQRFTPRQRPETVLLDLGDVAQDAVDLVAHRAQGSGVALGLERARDAQVSGARTELGQAVLNLLTNALDALEERGKGGTIALVVARRGDVVTLTAEDDGPGMSADELARAADLFFTTKEVGKGTGLGLALVHNVVEAHGGTVTLESEEGRNFRVTLAFPAARGGGGS